MHSPLSSTKYEGTHKTVKKQKVSGQIDLSISTWTLKHCTQQHRAEHRLHRMLTMAVMWGLIGRRLIKHPETSIPSLLPRHLMFIRNLAPGACQQAPGTRHLAPGTWHLAPGTWHLDTAYNSLLAVPSPQLCSALKREEEEEEEEEHR